MLLTDFYTIDKTEQTDAGTVFHITLNEKHAIYQGHFPGQPVLPGVCTLNTVKECAEQIVNKPLIYTQISSCKFLSSVDPTVCNKITLSLALKPNEDDTYTLSADGTNNEVAFIKIKAQMKKIDN